MNQDLLIISERTADIGGFVVGRVLPSGRKRMVGPFIYVDHMGPVTLGPDAMLEVLPHPHIGLATLTYLLEGAILHRDSLGCVQEIRPGAVNWMVAGRGIVHSERTPESLRGFAKPLHGLQIWIALPATCEETDPGFTHIPREDVPVWQNQTARFTLIAGEAFGRSSAVPVFSPLVLLEVQAMESGRMGIGIDPGFELGVYILKGRVGLDGDSWSHGNLVVLPASRVHDLEMETGSHLFLMGGRPFEEERFIEWNFVSSRRDRIDAAKARWTARGFDQVPGESAFVPLPSGKKP